MIRFLYACLAIMAMIALRTTSVADPIHDAVRGGQAGEIETILADDSSAVNAPDESGGSPLHLAARRGLVEITGLLIDAGADIDAVDGRGMTPLRWAIYSLQIETAQALLERGAATDDTHPMFGSVLDQAFTYLFAAGIGEIGISGTFLGDFFIFPGKIAGGNGTGKYKTFYL